MDLCVCLYFFTIGVCVDSESVSSGGDSVYSRNPYKCVYIQTDFVFKEDPQLCRKKTVVKR